MKLAIPSFAAQAFPLSVLPNGACLLLPAIFTACCLHLILTSKMKKNFLKLGSQKIVSLASLKAL